MIKVAYHPMYAHPLPAGHRFPMQKYELLPKQLLHEGTCINSNFFLPDFPDLNAIYAAHCPDYVKQLIDLTLDSKSIRKIGFPLSKELVDRELLIADGSIKAAVFALEHGVALNIAGGTHHAYSNRGEAFCLLNDQAIAARYLQRHHAIKKMLIVDLDVHQGNGTAEIFANDTSVFTFSMHGASNYPFKKEISDLDIALPKETSDKDYLHILENTLPTLIEEQRPDFIFYLSGVDILSSDKLGKINCTLSGCKERDRFVLSICKEYQLPVMCSMGGGYSPDIKTIIEAHANTYRVAKHLFD
ncbi:histone deacetylase family protein [Aquimarina intermedia]|uniref:Acetoin utilization deacetylase AcuC-like enzyme n=1 Tax=Aquimarina intermedia TaxID=350814 RepID=A0A5S5CCX1_9FLAO|nr:histone deacetylase [Aquimarina intermedia]TYP76999.1 acetoin utilization deacetylase AcuC-like enzyme [Aquimarina intermedia]